MGGFFMLFSLMILRMFPLMMLWIVKDRKKIKAIFVLSGGVILIGFFMSAVKIFQQEGWRSLVFILLGMFPHYLCYGFSFWILLRCIWYAWSDRVWKRIRLFQRKCDSLDCPILLACESEHSVQHHL